MNRKRYINLYELRITRMPDRLSKKDFSLFSDAAMASLCCSPEVSDKNNFIVLRMC